ncbi:MAG: arylsulfatase [Isosphaeraceae bacterium]
MLVGKPGHRRIAAAMVAALALTRGVALGSQPERRPNIVLIMTDDQGYGDVGFHGNPRIRTPNLDRLARESVRMANFCVSPVCSPTRSSLLTGRYNYRTGVVDTYLGRSMMRPDETTIAEVLGPAGYRTAIFGKWHLGDNAPMRPIDQGFQRELVIKGGGLGQPSNPPGGEHYLDPILEDDGRAHRFQGYCSDIYTSAAIDFLTAKDDRPFFAYLAFNCPHEPLEAPSAELDSYKGVDLSASAFPQLGHPIPENSRSSNEDIARVYAMVTNIDTNVGRLLKALDERGIARDTIVIFLTDNGPARFRFNGGLRGAKGTPYDGGIRVPFLIRWPGHLTPGRVVNPLAAHIDVFPTLLDACGVPLPTGLKIDGKSLMPLLRGDENVAWPDRTLFFQWHRGDVPELGRAFGARTQRYKLVRRESPPPGTKPPPLELYDLEADPYEEHNIAAKKPRLVERMYAEYVAWFKDVTARGFDPVRIDVGGPLEDTTVLTRQDWRGPRAGWKPDNLGYWELQIVRRGHYRVDLRLAPRRFPTVAHVKLGGVERSMSLEPAATACTLADVDWPAGPGRLETWIEGNGNSAGPLDVTIHRLADRP